MVASVSFQCLLFALAQLFLKIALNQFQPFSWSWSYFKSVFINPMFMLAGVCALSGMLLWMFILKKIDLSIAYPLTGISYIFGVMAAQWILHETIPFTRWVGVVIIMIGVFFVVK